MKTQKASEEMVAVQNEMDIISTNGEADQMKTEMEYIKQRKPLTYKRNQIIRKMPYFGSTFYESSCDPFYDR